MSKIGEMAGQAQSYTKDLARDATALTHTVKRSAVAVFAAKDFFLALLIGGVGLTFLGMHNLLSRWMDPAAAALLLGLGSIAVVFGFIAIALRKIAGHKAAQD